MSLAQGIAEAGAYGCGRRQGAKDSPHAAFPKQGEREEPDVPWYRRGYGRTMGMNLLASSLRKESTDGTDKEAQRQGLRFQQRLLS